MKISGTTYIHNAIANDYCISECIRSLVPFCDEVVCLECDSTDGTQELLGALSNKYPTLRIEHAKWTPGPGGDWLRVLSDSIRGLCSYPYRLHVQADEVLTERAGILARKYSKSLSFLNYERVNIWMRSDRRIPNGKICGHRVCRGVPVEACSNCDDESMIATSPELFSDGEIIHYSFVRNPLALAAKARAVHTAWFGYYDPIVDKLETDGLSALESRIPISECPHYEGTHPDYMVDWMRARNIPCTP